MSSPPKPVPQPTALSQPFWDGAREGRLLVQHCLSCGHIQHYPRDLCTGCWSAELEFRQVSGSGSVYTFSVVHRPPAPEFADTPYVVGLVDLDEGVRMLARIEAADIDSIRIGSRVHAMFESRGDAAVPFFGLVE